MLRRFPVAGRRARVSHVSARLFSKSSLGGSSRTSFSSKKGLGAIATVALIGTAASLSFPVHGDAAAIQQPPQSMFPALTSSEAASDQTKSNSSVPMRSLVRAYVVYWLCSMPALVDHSPEILEFLQGIPLVGQIAEAVIRVTFFDHFVGGDSAEDCASLLRDLRARNMSVIFDYSVEVNEKEATSSLATNSATKSALPTHKLNVDEMIHAIDVAADFEDSLGTTGGCRKTWVAIKLTALLPDASSLTRVSSLITKKHHASNSPIPFPGTPAAADFDLISQKQAQSSDNALSSKDKEALLELYHDMVRICRRAKERDVKISIDAEYSWYQPAVDMIALALMREFNSLKNDTQGQPLIYNTYQAYLRRVSSHLVASLEDAKKNNYALGVKLVRGAYHPYENTAFHARPGTSPSISMDTQPPVWQSKQETDQAYDYCANLLVDEVLKDVKAGKGQHIGLLFGTHNWASSQLVLRRLVETGLATEEEALSGQRLVRVSPSASARVTMSQLYGMADELTEFIAARTEAEAPFVVKYLPYGPLKDVMPYLGRRAVENKSVLGNDGARLERKRVGKEIWRRVSGWNA